jgi:hypothetical protein
MDRAVQPQRALGQERNRRQTVIRLHITAEGSTEQSFVKKVMTPYLARFGIYADARSVLTSKDKKIGREYRGGFRRKEACDTAKRDILSWMSEDTRKEARFTTMFDLYALPESFPGWLSAIGTMNPYERVHALESAFGEDIRSSRDDPRFLPYIQLHEFEALVLACPRNIDWEYLEHEEAISALEKVLNEHHGNPEAIDDGAETSPSKRILQVIPEYDKATAGPSIAGKTGMETLLSSCRHFKAWIDALMNL